VSTLTFYKPFNNLYPLMRWPSSRAVSSGIAIVERLLTHWSRRISIPCSL